MLDGAGGARMGLTSARAPSRRSDRQSSILARSFGQKLHPSRPRDRHHQITHKGKIKN